MKLILASNSPRRKDILIKLGYSFDIITSNFEEKMISLDAELLAKTFAFSKAKDVFDRLESKEDCVVLGADTIVVFNDEILGKPKDEQEAFSMLKKLSNNTHKVITGYAIISKDFSVVDFDQSFVHFNDLSDALINQYIKSGLYKGKAGAYGIQDKEYDLVKSYEGSLNNIIGLPSEKIMPVLNEIIQ